MRGVMGLALVAVDVAEIGVEIGVAPAGGLAGAYSVEDGSAIGALVVVAAAVAGADAGLDATTCGVATTKRRANEVCASGFCTAIVNCAGSWATRVTCRCVGPMKATAG